MKRIPVLWFRRMQFIPLINLLSFFLFMWNAIVSKSYFRMMIRGFGVVLFSFLAVRFAVAGVAMVLPAVKSWAGLIMGYAIPVLYTYGFIRLQE